MKKVRLFAVAAAMGMFASTVAAAETTTTTGYVANWDGVEEIIKVDVSNKVVAPVSTIKVVKETRTTDIDDALDSDELGIAFDEIDCYVGNTDKIGEDENEDSYTDHQVYFINGQEGYFTSIEEAVRAWGLTDGNLVSGKFLAPGVAEVEDPIYVAQYANKHFTEWEDVLAYAEEEGFVSYVYDEDGELTNIILNETEITDKKGNVKFTAAVNVEIVSTSKYAEEDAKKAVVASLVNGFAELNTLNTNSYWRVNTAVKENYTSKTPYNYGIVATEASSSFESHINSIQNYYVLSTGVNGYAPSVLVVEADRYGDLIPVAIEGGVTTTPAYGYRQANGTALEIDPSKITVLVREEADRDFKTLYGENVYYNKLMTIDPAQGAKWSAKAKMVWDIEEGTFVKEELGYSTYLIENAADASNADYDGFWWAKPVELNEDEPEPENGFVKADVQYGKEVLGLTTLAATPENDTDKIVIFTDEYNTVGISTKTGEMTISPKHDSKTKLNVSYAKLDGKYYPAVNTEAELVKVVAKLAKIGKFEVPTGEVDGLTEEYIEYLEEDATKPGTLNTYETWYENTEELAKNPWSGFTFEGELPYNQLRGADAKACTYKVASGEEVTAEVVASEVDTTEAGVKTMTLSAKVDGEVVATKDVKVVVAPRYERTYVNGKVAVLKAYYAKAEKVLYSEYHYDWEAGTYTATFYANDGVTVASTANGTL